MEMENYLLFPRKKITKRIPHPSERCRLIVFSLLCSHSKYKIAQELVEASRRYIFNIPGLALRLKKCFPQDYISVCLRSGIFVFLVIDKSSTVASRRVNRGISSAIYFIQLKKPASFHRRVYLRIPW